MSENAAVHGSEHDPCCRDVLRVAVELDPHSQTYMVPSTAGYLTAHRGPGVGEGGGGERRERRGDRGS